MKHILFLLFFLVALASDIAAQAPFYQGKTMTR